MNPRSAAAETGRAAASASRSRGEVRAAIVAAALIGVLAARALLGEGYERVHSSFVDVAATSAPTPLSAALLDALLLLLSAILLLLRPPPQTLVAVAAVGAFCLMGAGVLVSIGVAAEKRLAALAGANLWSSAVAAGALGLAAARDPRVRRLALAALLAAGATIAAKCAWQRADAPAVREAWDARRTELIANGAGADDPLLVNMDRRVRSMQSEAFAFHPHPNVNAMLMLMALVTTVGAALDARRSPASALLLAILASGISAGVWLTGSQGAMASAVGGITLLAVIGVAMQRDARGVSEPPQPAQAFAVRRVLLSAGVGYAGLIALGLAWVTLTGRLPHPSLEFRWHYWTAAAAIWANAALTGVGRLNFADPFLLFRSEACVEEVRDPHNLWVTLAVECGPLALAAGVVLIALVMRAATASISKPERELPEVGGVIGPIAAVVVVSLAIAHGCAGGLVAPAAAAWWLIEVVATFALSMWLVWWAVGQASGESSKHTGGRSAWLAAGCAGAIGAVLLHGLVDFGLTTPAGAAMFALLVAVATSGKSGAGAVSQSRRGWVGAAGAAGVALALVGQVVSNVGGAARSEALLTRAALLAARAPGEVADGVERGAADHSDGVTIDQWDADALRSVAAVLLELRSEDRHFAAAADRLHAALRVLRAAEAINPRSAATVRRIARALDALAELRRQGGSSDAARAAAVEASRVWRRVIALSPSDPRAYLACAAAAWRASDGPDVSGAVEIRGWLRRAREIDAKRPSGDSVRLTPAELKRAEMIEDALENGAKSDQVVP